MEPRNTRTTTVRLPVAVYDEAKGIVEEKGMSLNDLMVAAIKAYLKMSRRRRIDAAFAGMAADADYRKEAISLAEEFEESDWEALTIEEKDVKREFA